MKNLYSILFTEYPGHLGFAPAVVTLALAVVVCGALIYGGVTAGKAMFTHAPVETSHS